MSSVVIRDGVIYGAGDRGVLSATNSEDGSTIKQVRIIGNLSSSPLLAGGNLYVASRDGKMVVVSCDKELEIRHKFDFGSPVLASPSPFGSDLIVRTEKELIRIGSK